MKKISVLFVCLGNICRSPAAESIFISLLVKKGLKDGFIVDSAGTGSWHIGKEADSRMRIAAERRDINILSKARQITSKDFDDFNYILAMDDSNFRNIQDLKNRTASTGFASIKKIQDFRSVFNEQEVPDPYFGGDEGFDYVLDILEDSVNGFFGKYFLNLFDLSLFRNLVIIKVNNFVHYLINCMSVCNNFYCVIRFY